MKSKFKTLQIGYDNFGDVVTNDLGFIDKTLFIKEVFDHKDAQVSIITRPRRFGKTFNLSTLYHFLSPKVLDLETKPLFNGLKISTVDNGPYMQYQGKYPVISISFKDVKDGGFYDVVRSMTSSLQRLFRSHYYLTTSDRLTQKEKTIFDNYFTSKDRLLEDIKQSLLFLSELLYKHYGTKPWILIDEYDTPIQVGYIKNYYSDIVGLVRGMFGAALKSNPYLNRAVITGILRISKESLFSDLNNANIYSVLDNPYSAHFGFTESEVHNILINAGLNNKEQEVKQWYNGYTFGCTTVYNPWSIVNYVNSGILKPYWLNTSGNDLIKQIVTNSKIDFKQKFEFLLQNQTVSEIIDENMVFSSLDENAQAAWGLMVMSGYLKVISKTNDNPRDHYYNCSIPNLEIEDFYCNIIKTWLSGCRESIWYSNFLTHLLSGNIQEFTESLKEVLLNIVSVHDTAKYPEAFYRGIFIGLLAGLGTTDYEYKSNKESGLGKYDIAIFPKDISKSAVILEFKSVKKKTELAKASKDALKQINKKQYVVAAKQRGFSNIIKIGIGFSGRECNVAV